MARRPLGGPRRSEQQLIVGAELVDEVRAVVIEIHREAGGAQCGRGSVRVRGAVEERLLAFPEFEDARAWRRKLDRRVFLPGIELDAAVHRIGQFEGSREVDLHAAVVGVGQRRVRISGDVVPEEFGGVVHRIAGRDASLLGGPGGKAGDADSLGELVGLRITGRVGEVLRPPDIKIEAGRQLAL